MADGGRRRAVKWEIPDKTWEWDRWEYCVGNEKTYVFLQAVLSQVMDLFPSDFIHIGGDE